MSNEESSGEFLSAAEVGQRIGRGDDTVRRMWTDGSLPFTTLNGRRVTPRGALEEWIARHNSAAMGNVKEQE